MALNSIISCWKAETDGYGMSTQSQPAKNALSELAGFAWNESDIHQTLYINRL